MTYYEDHKNECLAYQRDYNRSIDPEKKREYHNEYYHRTRKNKLKKPPKYDPHRKPYTVTTEVLPNGEIVETTTFN